MDSLVANIEFDQHTNTYVTTSSNHITEVHAAAIPFSPRPDPRRVENIPRARRTPLQIFPDSGATICLGGPKHLHLMGLKENNLIPSKKVVRTVGGFTLVCQGWLPVRFIVGKRSTKQALYVCKGIERLYFSRAACIGVGILPQCFPTPMENTNTTEASLIANDIAMVKCHPDVRKQLPTRPEKPPFPANEENVDNLKKWLLEQFANSSFNNDGKFPAMAGPPAHIHLKEGATPKARHSPIPVPFHFKEPVRQALWKDVERGIITPVPVGTPTDWRSAMMNIRAILERCNP